MKKLLLVLIGVGFLAWAVFMFWQSPKNQNRAIKQAEIHTYTPANIGNAQIEVEISDTPASREQGLSGRSGLEENKGMLFSFPEAGKYGFWMKDMNFSLDIVWIDESGKIVAIDKDVKPDSYPQVFYPPTEVKYVLELESNFCDTHNINIEDSFFLNS